MREEPGRKEEDLPAAVEAANTIAGINPVVAAAAAVVVLAVAVGEPGRRGSKIRVS